MKKILNAIFSVVFGIIGITCILYYSNKFYTQKFLNFESNDLLSFCVLASMIIISLIIGILSYFKLQKMEEKLRKITEENNKLLLCVTENHFSGLSAIKDNMV